MPLASILIGISDLPTAAIEYLDAILLGVVQGIAEFLPISSSGHLVIVDALWQELGGSGIGQDSFQLNAALHVGTLFSILVVYRRDLQKLVRTFRLCWLIAVATLPLVFVALVPSLIDRLETAFHSPLSSGFGLLATAIILLIGQRLERGTHAFDDLPVWGAVLVGLFQALALFPGVSRSGSTIAGGLLTGLRREEATTFSFFIAIPAISGAAVLLIRKIWKSPDGVVAHDLVVLSVGALTAFLVGTFALRWLLRLVSQRKLHWFAWYCATVGLATILWQAGRPLSENGSSI